MRIGYNQATSRGCSTLENDLRLCEELGFDEIEIRTDKLREYLIGHSMDELKAFFAASRLKAGAMNAFYLYPEFLGGRDDPARRQALLDEMLLGLWAAREIGSTGAIVVAPLQRDPKGGPYRGEWEETFGECVRILTLLSDMFSFYGVRICFEPVGFDRSGVRTLEQANAIIAAVNRENVGLVLDSYNIYLYDQSNDFSGILSVPPEKIFDVHLVDADAAPVSEMGQDKRCFPGFGCVDTVNFLCNLRKAGYAGAAFVETFRPEYWERDPEWVLRESYRTAREVMERAGVFPGSAVDSAH